MITIYSNQHHLHRPEVELHGGDLIPHYEVPERVQAILDRIEREGLGSVRSPDPLEPSLLRRVHDPGLLDFLETAAQKWSAAGRVGAVMPYTWRHPSPHTFRPQSIDGLAGWYATDACTPITTQTWSAAVGAAAVAVTGARLLMSGATAVAAMTRPPGHHAGFAYYGGYCYLNNAALAADLLAERENVMILDIDYHHGNGTQDIFWSRADVVYASVHASTCYAFPYFSGAREEIGAGVGQNANRNYPIPPDAPTQVWVNAFTNALSFGAHFRPRYMVVSLGMDTADGDPVGTFHLDDRVYAQVGREIARLGIPTLYVLEGGYHLDTIGRNLVALLRSHDQESGSRNITQCSQIVPASGAEGIHSC
jgi:acetoin utilization deacetylase AcuC-like enzyme